MRGNNIPHHRQPRITLGWTLVESHFKSPCFRIKLLHVQFPANLTTTWQWISRINLIHCLLKNTNYFNLLCLKLAAVEVRHAAPPVYTPTCTLHQLGQTSTPRQLAPTPSPPIRSLTLCPELPETARGVQKHNLTLGKGQISHSACLWALGTKATEFTSINWALAFVLGNGGLGVGPSPDQPLLECTVRGSQTSGPAALWLMYPCHVTRTAAHTHTLTRIHTPPCPQHSPACTIQYPQTTSNEKPHSSFWKVMVSPPKMAAPGPEGCNAWTTNPPSCGHE